MNVPINKKIIIVPAAVYQQTIRNNLTLDALLDLDSIMSQFSLEDLVFMYNVNEQNSIVYNQLNISNDLIDYWADSENYSKIFAVKELYKADTVRKLEEEHSLRGSDALYELKNTQQDVIFCIVYPKMFVSKDLTNNASLEITKAILKLLYDYNSYSVVASHPLYNGYMAGIN